MTSMTESPRRNSSDEGAITSQRSHTHRKRITRSMPTHEIASAGNLQAGGGSRFFLPSLPRARRQTRSSSCRQTYGVVDAMFSVGRHRTTPQLGLRRNRSQTGDPLEPAASPLDALVVLVTHRRVLKAGPRQFMYCVCLVMLSS